MPFAYVPNWTDNTVSYFTTGGGGTPTPTTISDASFNYPLAAATSPDGTKVYVTNQANGFAGTVSVIDTISNTVTKTINVGNSPHGVAFVPNGTKAYVANQNSNTV